MLARGAALILISLLASASPGCATYLVQSICAEARPRHEIFEPRAAYAFTSDEGTEDVMVEARHDGPLPAPPGEPHPLGLVRVRYRLRDARRDGPVEPCAIEALPADAKPLRAADLGPGSFEVGVVIEEKPWVGRRWTVAPSHTLSGSRAYRLAHYWREPDAGVEVIQVVSIPVTVAIDVALLPVYLVVATGLLIHEVVD